MISARGSHVYTLRHARVWASEVNRQCSFPHVGSASNSVARRVGLRLLQTAAASKLQFPILMADGMERRLGLFGPIVVLWAGRGQILDPVVVP